MHANLEKRFPAANIGIDRLGSASSSNNVWQQNMSTGSAISGVPRTAEPVEEMERNMKSKIARDDAT